jgi:hypothetical protein
MLPQTSSGRWLAGITAGVLALIIISIVVTLVAAGNAEPLPEGSPEAAVQNYLQAIDDGDLTAAYAMLADDRQATCDATEYRQFTQGGRDADMRLSLDNVDVIDTTALVAVRVTSFRGDPPFDFSENSYSALFQLELVDGTWRVEEAPWPFSGCPFVPRKLPLEQKPTPTATPVAPKK